MIIIRQYCKALKCSSEYIGLCADGKVILSQLIPSYTMAHKRSLETLDRTSKDIRDNQNIFGEVMIILLGDFH